MGRPSHWSRINCIDRELTRIARLVNNYYACSARKRKISGICAAIICAKYRLSRAVITTIECYCICIRSYCLLLRNWWNKIAFASSAGGRAYHKLPANFTAYRGIRTGCFVAGYHRLSSARRRLRAIKFAGQSVLMSGNQDCVARRRSFALESERSDLVTVG